MLRWLPNDDNYWCNEDDHEATAAEDTTRLQPPRLGVGLFIAAVLGPPIVNGLGDFMQRHAAVSAGRLVSAVGPALLRGYSIWSAINGSTKLERRMRDIERRLPQR
jgi:hypothetical protein